MMRKEWALVLAAALAAGYPAGAPAQDPPVGRGKTLFVESIDAEVNGEVILAGEVEEMMEIVQQQYGRRFETQDLYDRERRKILNEMIDDLLIYQAGVEKGYDLRKNQLEERVNTRIQELEESEAIKRQGGIEDVLKKAGRSMEGLRRSLERQIRRQYVRDVTVRMNIEEKVKVSDREIDRFLRENPDYIRKEQTVKVRQIFFSCPKNAPEEKVEEVRKRAEDVYLQILAGADFSQMARQHSDHTLTQRVGGEMPPYTRGELSDSFDVAFDMEVGEVCEPFRTAAGFHILKLEEKPSIEQIVENKRKSELLDKWLQELRTEAVAKGTLRVKGSEPGEESPPLVEHEAGVEN